MPPGSLTDSYCWELAARSGTSTGVIRDRKLSVDAHKATLASCAEYTFEAARISIACDDDYSAAQLPLLAARDKPHVFEATTGFKNKMSRVSRFLNR